METVTVYEGTWEEVLAHKDEFAGHYVQVKVIQDPDIAERLARMERSLEGLRKIGAGKGPFPEREITLDDRYPDRDAPY